MINSEFFARLPPGFQRRYLLERVFLPDDRRHRDRLYQKDEHPRFVHYTSAVAALSIIGKKRLWLRNTNSMVDYREVHHGHQLLLDVFGENDAAIEKSLIAACDIYFPGVASEAIALFNGWWKAVPQGITTNTYIASVSEHDLKEDQHGRLSMWRAFGAAAPARVAMVLKPPKFSSALTFMSCMFNPVMYFDKAGLEQVVRETIESIERESELIGSLSRQEMVDWLFSLLLVKVTCLKHEGFSEEREWRIIYSPSRAKSDLIEEELQIIGGIPQSLYKLPLDRDLSPELADIDVAAMLDRVIIGPSSQPWVLYEAFVKALQAVGVTDAAERVITSGIPLRLT